ncbi:Phage repressor protein C, contains Cro/C1-type HTH and peptisase s24 domains [Hymenobacter psychrotolerans DSM 18569]|uniref:Phage repressor protein C, contains Cro/C1-type HTH and peptisase s24 domains n=1 Tax=Hymenobacter psychrotolerans DSM 18569 TaxID=1121959 RepID=A0A1M7G8H5_9BACT|nr:Phage repressor protein C, contains Cro/C1-type HTH and peptisase s24 domains [Hymenobacter psychrotolerans DSM 18569]
MEQAESQKKKLPAGVDGDTGARIKQLFEHHGISTYEANQRLGYSRTSKLYKVLSGEVRPSYETLVDLLAEFPDASPDWLLMGKGPMLRAAAKADAAPKSAVLQQVVRGDKVVVVTVDEKGKENTVFVPIPAQAGYAVSHNEAVFVRQLSNFKIPGFDRGEYRAFEVSGDSMEPTINHRDIVITSRVDELRLLEPGEVYVVVTPETVMLKRIKDQVRGSDNEVVLYSDNAHRRPYHMETRDIEEIWRVRGYVSSYIPSAPDVTIERLWEVIEELGFDRGTVRRHLDEGATSDATL